VTGAPQSTNESWTDEKRVSVKQYNWRIRTALRGDVDDKDDRPLLELESVVAKVSPLLFILFIFLASIYVQAALKLLVRNGFAVWPQKEQRTAEHPRLSYSRPRLGHQRRHVDGRR